MEILHFAISFIIGGCRRHTLHVTRKIHLSPSILIITAKLHTSQEKLPPCEFSAWFHSNLVMPVNTTWEVLHVLTGLAGFDWQLWSEYKVSLSSWKKKKIKNKIISACLSLFEEVQYNLREQKFCSLEPVMVVKYPSWKVLLCKQYLLGFFASFLFESKLRKCWLLTTLCKTQNKMRVRNSSVFDEPLFWEKK